MTSFALLKILANLIFPPASLAIAVVLALLLAAMRWRRAAWTVLVLGLVQTLVLSFPPVGDALTRILEEQSRAAERQAQPCCYDAIVVLGGGVGPAHPPERPYPDLTDSSDRVWQAARLWRQGAAPRIIVSGGSYNGQRGGTQGTEAEAMRAFLLDLGVPPDAIVDEAKAVNTIENIRNVKAMVGDGRVALVTSSVHMPRALQLARRAGLDASAFATDYQAVADSRLPWDNWLPSIDGLRMSSTALREMLALQFDFRR